MPPHRPEIFVSATSQDLRTCRQLIKEALLTLGCVPVEQTNFPPDARTVREMLRAKITACDAVVHVAGEVYGAEPSARDPAEPRRSYTQLEYELATEFGKPVYVFVCGTGFPYDEHSPEDAERQALQQQHRTRLQKSDHIYTPVGSRDELALRVHALQTRVEALSGELNKARSWLGRGITIGLVALTLLGGGIWWLNKRADKTDIKITKLETELDKQRRYIKSVADAFTEQQSQLRQLKLTDDEIFNRAVANVATKDKVSEAELRSGIDLFVAAIRADPKADFFDRALAEFAQKNFAAAADSAGHAGNAARDQYLAADKLAAQAAARGDEARTHAREAFSLQGQSLYAERTFGEAVTAFEAGIEAAPRAKVPQSWAELQVSLGMALNEWAAVVTGSAITEQRAKAVAAYRAALEVYTREALPQDWARTQNNLAIALWSQAVASAGPDRARLLAEAVAAFRATLEVFTRKALPQDWATTQNNLAAALSKQAAASAGPESLRLLAEAVAAYRAALEVYTREGVPQDWAIAQNNLANALCDQAASSTGSESARLLAEAVAAYRAALGVYTREALPEEWAMTQNNLGAALRDQAAASDGPDSARLLAGAVAAYRAALEVRTRKALPQDWATTQSNLAVALCNQAAASGGPEGAPLLAEAVAAYRATLEVYTRKVLPQDWARTQNNLASALCSQAATSAEPDGARLLAEAVAAYRAALEIRTREALPQEWAKTQNNLANALCNQAAASAGPETARLLTEAIAAKRAALEILTSEVDPEWYRQQLEWIAQAEAVLKKL
jgi:N6-adenosine-specific RNA methylase IME4